jgi:hypothetical protein
VSAPEHDPPHTTQRGGPAWQERNVAPASAPAAPAPEPQAHDARDLTTVPGVAPPTTDIAPASPTDVQHVDATQTRPAAAPEEATTFDAVHSDDATAPQETRLSPRPLETRIGGVLFLLVVAQRLGLYADFTEPAGRNLLVDPWRFVARVGARLLDADEDDDDPLWTLLDELTRDDDELAPDELDFHVAAIRDWLELHVDLPLPRVLELAAFVHADETRVDAVFSLVEHPIEIRIAGLDIDPGWIPAAGRALHFHFE